MNVTKRRKLQKEMYYKLQVSISESNSLANTMTRENRLETSGINFHGFEDGIRVRFLKVDRGRYEDVIFNAFGKEVNFSVENFMDEDDVCIRFVK